MHQCSNSEGGLFSWYFQLTNYIYIYNSWEPSWFISLNLLPWLLWRLHQFPFRILWKPESKNNWIIYPHIPQVCKNYHARYHKLGKSPFKNSTKTSPSKTPRVTMNCCCSPNLEKKLEILERGTSFQHELWLQSMVSEETCLRRAFTKNWEASTLLLKERSTPHTHTRHKPAHLFNGYRSKEIREVRGWLAIEGFFQGNEFVAPDISQSPRNHGVRSAGVIGGYSKCLPKQNQWSKDWEMGSVWHLWKGMKSISFWQSHEVSIAHLYAIYNIHHVDHVARLYDWSASSCLWRKR